MLKWAWFVPHQRPAALAVCQLFSHLQLKKLGLSEEEQLNFLLAAGAFGLVIANNASISGAEGGCQAEVGSASAMSAAALVLAAGGSPFQASQAICFCHQKHVGFNLRSSSWTGGSTLCQAKC